MVHDAFPGCWTLTTNIYRKHSAIECNSRDTHNSIRIQNLPLDPIARDHHMHYAREFDLFNGYTLL